MQPIHRNSKTTAVLSQTGIPLFQTMECYRASDSRRIIHVEISNCRRKYSIKCLLFLQHLLGMTDDYVTSNSNLKKAFLAAGASCTPVKPTNRSRSFHDFFSTDRVQRCFLSRLLCEPYVSNRLHGVHRAAHKRRVEPISFP